MNRNSAAKARPSLLERAAEIYDFGSGMRVSEDMLCPIEARVPVTAPEPQREPVFSEPEPVPAEAAPAEVAPVEAAPQPIRQEPAPVPEPAALRRQAPLRPSFRGRIAHVEREKLEEAGFILPDAPPTALAEEFRIVKRQLLLGAAPREGDEPVKRQTILVCSAQPDDGKTFCALNLALSLAGEEDIEVLLVDGDFSKPEILSMLGIEDGPGLIDAVADPGADPNDYVIRTDVGGLSVLPAGRQANNVTELIASERTRHVLNLLTAAHPRRLVIFDSPPALMASPASVLACHVGQVMLVVRADRTTEADLKEAVGLLSGCDNLSLLLNGTGFAATGRRFGSYYGYGQ